MTRITGLRTEYLEEPLAVPSDRPRFSWRIESDEHDLRQSRFRIAVRSPDGATVWDPGWTDSAESTLIAYEGEPLAADTDYQWTVEAEIAGSLTRSSARFSTGPAAERWEEATWITIPRARGLHADRRTPAYLVRSLPLAQRVRRARLYITAGGVYTASVNGEPLPVGDLAPGWTDYRYRVPYQAFDVRPLLARDNVIAVIVADGWYCGYVAPYLKRDHWGDAPVLKCILSLEYEDGGTALIMSDESWAGSSGPIRGADLLHGEVYDARVPVPADASIDALPPAVRHPGPTGEILPARIAAAGPVAEVAPASISNVQGSHLVDFGQNLAGRVRLRATGAAGTVIQIRHAEILRADGTLDTDNLRSARATDTWILDGRGEAWHEPAFTFHGFRYAEITGYPGELSADDVRAVVVSSVREMTGTLQTDNALVNQLMSNITWSMRGNFIEVPMDCPQRDERLGWGGDAQAFAPTATMLADVGAFLTKWTDDLLDAQKLDGTFADIAPGVVLDFTENGAPGYAEAAIIIPWAVYQAYGDLRVLERALPPGERWIRRIVGANADLIWRHGRNTDYGDWLAPVETDKTLVATAHLARSVQLVASFAAALGRTAEERHYRRLHERVRAAFQHEFFDDHGAPKVRTQAAQVLAIAFDLVDPVRREAASAALIEDIERRRHVTVGFLSLPYLMPVLDDIGRVDLAYELLLRRETPSWGYQIDRGMTTIGEHWDAWQPDGTLVDPWMNSFNHFALGSVGTWLFDRIGGIASLEPGYASVRVAPIPHASITSGTSSVRTVHGTIAVDWRLVDEDFALALTVPPGVTAFVELPRGVGVSAASTSPEVLTVGSGTHRFSSRVSAPALPR